MGVKRSEMALYVWFTHNPAEGVEISGVLLCEKDNGLAKWIIYISVIKINDILI